jgi:predicted TIM-barrel fold metal-dependent hydrolase
MTVTSHTQESGFAAVALADGIEIVDAQIHIWQDDSLRRPWTPFADTRRDWLNHGQAITGDRAIAAMDAVGVSAGVITAFMIYDDIDYGVESLLAHPDRFSLVAQVDLQAEAPRRIAKSFTDQADLVAFRLAFMPEDGEVPYERLARGEFDGIFSVAREHDLAVMLVVPGHLPAVVPLFARYPDITFFIDHLGVAQGHHYQPGADSFTGLSELLACARHSNVAIKLSGVPTLSAQRFPYLDVWPHVRRIVDAFGPERIAWGSDFGRTRPKHSYSEAVDFIRYSPELSDDEKRQILGQSLRRILHWPAPQTHA